MSRLGACPSCKSIIADADTLFVGGKLDAQIRTIKRYHDGVERGIFLTTLGTQVHLTMCESCLHDVTPEKLHMLWKYVIEGMRLEVDPEYRKEVGAGPLNPEQTKIQKDSILKLEAHTLLGLYCKHKV